MPLIVCSHSLHLQPAPTFFPVLFLVRHSQHFLPSPAAACLCLPRSEIAYDFLPPADPARSVALAPSLFHLWPVKNDSYSQLLRLNLTRAYSPT